MATLTVGQGQQFTTIAAAVAASHDGDVVQVQAGTYTNDFAEITTKITLQGVGGMVHMVATQPIPNDKGILVTDTDVTIDHFEFSGATGPSGNDAGVRYQAGNLTLTNDYFHNNQDGLLANPSATGTITISNSEFANNGTGDGYTHNLYVGDIAKLSISNSYFHDAVVGHEIKSRAEVTQITNTRIFDNSGSASYSVDLPNGGQATLSGNTIEQGPNSSNPNIIAYGEEGGLHTNSGLTLSANTVLNDLAGKGALLWDASGTSATIDQTKVWGLGASQLVSGSGATVTNSTYLASEPALDTSHPWSGSTSTSNPPPTTPTPPPTTSTTPETLQAGAASPDLVGGTADDTLTGWSGSDSLHGGAGNDSISGGTGFNDVNGNQGDDTIVGHSQVGDWLLGGQGNDQISATASTAHNFLHGNMGNDTVTGGSGGDTLLGGQGDDSITGGAGADLISGDKGHDTLTGGAGADTFHGSAGMGTSVITDFHQSQGDHILLDHGTQYTVTQAGADVHVDLSGGGELVLQNTQLSSLSSGWIMA
jgi:Ca2+-binding RTX toxin-like protein